MSVIITPHFPADKASLLWSWMKLDQDLNFDDFGPKTLCHFKSELARRVQHEMTWGVYVDRELAGYLGAVRQSPMSAFTHGIVISPVHRGKGVGYAAVQLMLADLHELGVTKVLAGFFADNLKIKSLFKRLGGVEEAYFTDVTRVGGELTDMRIWSLP